jgi:N-hydroxyarylamine O-acetyltransferase
VAGHPDEIDLPAYFNRIGYARDRDQAEGGNPAPTLATLSAIQRHHAQAIPFENLSPLAGWPVRLDLASLEQKLVRDGRGGYCFEQNLLLSHALRALAFDVKWLAARVVLNVADQVVGGRTHMLLLVTVDQVSYVVDVGFGGLTLTAPLRLETGVAQPTPHEPCRLMRSGEEFMVEAEIAGDWRPLYRFGLQEQLLPDYEICNWYLSTHPQSRFVLGLMAARPDIDRRYALRNNELAVHHLGGPTERRLLQTAAELKDALENLFHVKVPDRPELQTALSRVAASTATQPGG